MARILRLRGFGVYDCDYEARKLMEGDETLKQSLREIAGEETYAPDGTLQRQYLASQIFGNEETRGRVNRVVHSAVRADIERWMAESPRNIFVETAIAAESGIAEKADAIWLVEASPETRRRRVKVRDGRNEAEISRIMEAQAEEARRLAEGGKRLVRIANDPDSRLLEQIDDEIQRIKTN